MAWIASMGVTDYELMNVWDLPTPKNRTLNILEIELGSMTLGAKLNLIGTPYVVVALGKTAERACKELQINPLTMPHPSPRNRVNNNKKAINLLLNKNRKTLESLRKNT
jgi:uracil-DNA glycosylase